jgi:mannose-6-phosphate isomerase-like protein (cupin superfamily)
MHPIETFEKEPTMATEAQSKKENATVVPPDDPQRKLASARSEDGRHIGIVGDTYTILVTGEDTAGRFCLIDMHVPPGGGPPPHRHDFEETFSLLEGELDLVFRGAKQKVRVGETVNIPANAPHQFHNSSNQPARMLCICSPAGQEEFFAEIGIPVATRTTPPPKLDEAAQAAFRQKAEALAPKYKTELLPPDRTELIVSPRVGSDSRSRISPDIMLIPLWPITLTCGSGPATFPQRR